MNIVLLGLFLLIFVTIGTYLLLSLAWWAGTSAADADAKHQNGSQS